MTCDEEVGLISDGLEGIGVDSGILAIVDASVSDRFLSECEAWYDGTLPPFGPDGLCSADGILLDAGDADIYRCEAEVCDLHAHGFTIVLDESPSAGHWVRIGQVLAPSRLLLVGDPGMLEEYAPYRIDGPVDAQGVWTALTLPCDRVDVHVLRESHTGSSRNLAIRVTEVR